MSTSELLRQVVSAALEELRKRGTHVYTFALYHDHESSAVSVCVDTEENSNRMVANINRYNMKHFLNAVQAGDLSSAALWQANIGRNLSLGDFSLVNLARTALAPDALDGQFYLEMVRTVVAVQTEVATLAPDPGRLLLASSGENDEVEYVWSLPEVAL